MARKKSAFERTEFIKITQKQDVYALADKILSGVPLVLNFESADTVSANQFILFLSGVLYAFDGHVEQLKEKILVFASKEAYQDAQLKRFIKDHKE
jgi:cell division inhibitor SepF